MSQCITFDSAVYTAMQQLKQQQTDSIPPLKQLATIYTPSQSLADRLEAIIAKAEKAFNRKRWGKNIARIAAAVIIAVTLLSANPTVATAMKKIFSQTVIQWFDKYIYVETKADIYPQAVKDFTVGYMTDGFVLVEEIPYGAGVYKVYEDINNDYISITVKPDTGGDLLALDTEHSIISEICIDGITGIKLNSNDGFNLLTISIDGVKYIVDGFVEFDEILKIYKNIKIYV